MINVEDGDAECRDVFHCGGIKDALERQVDAAAPYRDKRNPRERDWRDMIFYWIMIIV
jgi:hypothetical protein